MQYPWHIIHGLAIGWDMVSVPYDCCFSGIVCGNGKACVIVEQDQHIAQILRAAMKILHRVKQIHNIIMFCNIWHELC